MLSFINLIIHLITHIYTIMHLFMIIVGENVLIMFIYNFT